MKTFTYSYVKYSPRVPLVLLTVEKIERKNFDFVLLSFIFFLLFHHAYVKNYMAYTNDLHTKRQHYYHRYSFPWLELHAS